MIQELAGTAKIYQFPVGGRDGQRVGVETSRSGHSISVVPRGVTLGAGESWYHAEAVQAAQHALT